MGKNRINRAGGVAWLTDGNFPFSRVFSDMLSSPAWRNLNDTQISLYLWCQLWTHEAGTRPANKEDPQKYPRDKWKIGGVVRENDFYANLQKAKRCGLAKESTKKTFYQARKKLIEIGFIDCVIDGAKTSTRDSSVYRMSTRWKNFSPNAIKKQERK